MADELCDSLIVWVSSFDVEGVQTVSPDFTDGVIIAQILHQLDSEYFTKTWLSRIKPGSRENYRLKTNNVKKVLNQIVDYFKEVCGQTIVGYEMPEVQPISEAGDHQHLGRLLQLLLGVAVNCPSKQKHIQDIMELDENVQHVVMTAIQELMQHYQPLADEPSAADAAQLQHQMRELQEKLNDAVADKEEMAQRCHELDMQMALVHDEKSNIQLENDRLQERLNSENFEDPTSPSSIRHTQMMNQIEDLQEETYKLEASRDDYKLRCEMVEHDLLESQAKIDELSSLAEESRLLKDEIDYLQTQSDRASKLEATIDTYKTKLKELNELRGQVKLLEDKNTSYMERTIELEDELKKANVARSQLETSKRQMYDLQNKLSEETRRADRAEFEVKTRAEKMKNLQSENQRLVAERDSLQETNDELTMTSHTGGGNFMNEQLVGAAGDHENQLEIKEKLIRLQHENKMLKLEQQELGDVRVTSLSSDLDHANSRVNELETENRINKQRVMELESQVGDLQKDLEGKGTVHDENVALRKKVKEHIHDLQQTNEELQEKKNYIETMEPQLTQGGQQINEMKELLRKKEEDMRAMEDRYKKYLEKAKSVIRTLDPNKNQQSVAPQLNKLKSEIAEKEKYIKQLEKDHENSLQNRDQEEKMIVNAWYNMGMQLHRKAVDERLSHTSPGQSFLARQRQVSSQRRSHPGSIQRKETEQRHRVAETLGTWTYM